MSLLVPPAGRLAALALFLSALSLAGLPGRQRAPAVPSGEAAYLFLSPNTDEDLTLRVSYRKDGLLLQRQWLLLRPRLAPRFKDGIPDPPPWPCHVHVWTAGSATGVSQRSLHTMASVVAAWDEPTGRTTR